MLKKRRRKSPYCDAECAGTGERLIIGAIPVITWKEILPGVAGSSIPKMGNTTDATMPHNSHVTILKARRSRHENNRIKGKESISFVGFKRN